MFEKSHTLDAARVFSLFVDFLLFVCLIFVKCPWDLLLQDTGIIEVEEPHGI